MGKVSSFEPRVCKVKENEPNLRWIYYNLPKKYTPRDYDRNAQEVEDRQKSLIEGEVPIGTSSPHEVLISTPLIEWSEFCMLAPSHFHEHDLNLRWQLGAQLDMISKFKHD